jgi:hypothetical protein
VLHLICAFALWGAIAAPTQATFFLAVFVYFMCFHPSASLAASMTLHHLRRPERDFPIARAGGTAGWVVAGFVVGWAWPAITGASIEGTSVPMQIGVVASLATAAFALILPHTPPVNRRGRGTVAVPAPRPESDRLLADRRFLALITLSFFAHIPTQFYYAYGNVFFNWSGMQSTAAKMTLGQVVEVVVMLLLPLVLRRLSIKTMILMGLTFWGLRFLMLSAASLPATPGRDVLMYVAILLHGAAFTFVSISLQLDVDRCAGQHRRATAQGLFAVAYQGFGCFAGAQLAGLAAGRLMPLEVKHAAPDQWQTFWLLPASGILGVFILTLAVLRQDRT